MNKQKFKQTEIGEIPEDWGLNPLKELCENLDKMRKPITKSQRSPGDVPYYGATGIQDHVSGHLFDENLVLVAEDCGGYKSFGQTAYTISGKAWVNNHAHILRCKNINWIFLKEMLNYLDISKFINTGNRQKLNKSDLEKIPVPHPKVEEQQRIASVLSCVDSAIQQTNEVIEQARKLKKGLMQELLTRGIGHKKFKETEVGEVPDEWGIKALKEVNVKSEFVTPKELAEFYYIDVSSVSNERFAIFNTTRVSGKTAPGRARKKVLEGDIIFATVRPTLRRIAIVPKNLNGQIASTAFCVIRPQESKADNQFLYYLLQSDGFISKLTGKQVGATYPAVSDKIVLNQKIALPPIQEQHKISSIFIAANEKIESELEKRSQLERLKKGLMQDLLTGRVRFREFMEVRA